MSAETDAERTEIIELLCDKEAFPSVPKMLHKLHGIDVQMGYGDWVHPIKLTGGRVALSWEGKYNGGHVYYQKDGMLMFTIRREASCTGLNAVYCLRDTIENPEETIEPVLFENTPRGRSTE